MQSLQLLVRLAKRLRITEKYTHIARRFFATIQAEFMKSHQYIHESIAVDLAERIANGEFVIGEKISGRTLLASHYGVSSETIRKAVAFLRAANIVSVSQG